MTEFSKKTAFITGAASGIGLALTKALAAKGANVMMSDINGDALATLATDIKAGGGSVASIVCDVTDQESVNAAASATIAAFGNVHYVFNNAGIGVGGSAGYTKPAVWRAAVEINLMGVAYGVEAFVPHMKDHGEGGHIINTASMAGHMAATRMGPYNATKFAVVGYSESLRLELEPLGINVTTLSPTWVQSNIANASLAPKNELAEMIAGLVENGMPAEKFAELCLMGIAAKRMHVFNDPEARAVIDVRAKRLAADYDACLEDLKTLS